MQGIILLNKQLELLKNLLICRIYNGDSGLNSSNIFQSRPMEKLGNLTSTTLFFLLRHSEVRKNMFPLSLQHNGYIIHNSFPPISTCLF